jgi:L-ornithine N5-oxygenase
VGFGPANIALAVTLEELAPDLKVGFLEARGDADWQPGMLIDGADVQHNPLRDLATPRNPRSRYTFVNYLHENDRLYEHLNLKMEFPLRKEYRDYVRWVASHFSDRVRYGEPVAGLGIMRTADHQPPVYEVKMRGGDRYTSDTLVVAPGRTPYIPGQFAEITGKRVFHATEYLPRLEKLLERGTPSRVAVVGASQSAVEILLDLASRFPSAEVHGIHRSFSLRHKDLSPFSEEVFFPYFVSYYFNSSRESQKELNRHLRTANYASADPDVLNRLYEKIYEEKLDGRKRIVMKPNSEVISAEAGEGTVSVSLGERHRGFVETEEYDFVVLATGFRNLGAGEAEELYPPLLSGLADRLVMDDEGYVSVGHDYALRLAEEPEASSTLFLNGLCETSHGMGDAGSFSLLALRSVTIANALLDRLGASPRYFTGRTA